MFVRKLQKTFHLMRRDLGGGGQDSVFAAVEQNENIGPALGARLWGLRSMIDVGSNRTKWLGSGRRHFMGTKWPAS